MSPTIKLATCMVTWKLFKNRTKILSKNSTEATTSQDKPTVDAPGPSIVSRQMNTELMVIDKDPIQVIHPSGISYASKTSKAKS